MESTWVDQYAQKQETEHEKALRDAFPAVSSGKRPCGGRIQVQLRRVKETSKGGLILIEETKATEKWETTIGRLVKVGPLAFRHRETMKPWPEGAWAEIGQYITIPRWGGERWRRPIPGMFDPRGKPEWAYFAEVNDHEIIDVVEEDPLSFVAYVD
jgi:co-chaperonin GroES (HSP10)